METVVLVSDGDVDECTAGDLWVGEFFRADTTSRALVTFRLSALPGTIEQVEQAVLRFTEETRGGTPFGANNLGDLLVEHVSVELPITETAFNAPAIRLLGSIGPDAPEGVSTVDAAAAFEADYSGGSATSQFRLRFEKSIALAGTTEHVVIGCVNPNVELALDYLIP